MSNAIKTQPVMFLHKAVEHPAHRQSCEQTGNNTVIGAALECPVIMAIFSMKPRTITLTPEAGSFIPGSPARIAFEEESVQVRQSICFKTLNCKFIVCYCNNLKRFFTMHFYPFRALIRPFYRKGVIFLPFFMDYK
jgi:hypothetical protein